NLKHFMVSNHVYGSTNDLAHPFGELVDYAAIAQASGIERVYRFATLEGLAQGLDDMIAVPGHAFAVLEVEPLGRHLPSPPLARRSTGRRSSSGSGATWSAPAAARCSTRRCRGSGFPLEVRAPSFETPAFGGLLRMRPLSAKLAMRNGSVSRHPLPEEPAPPA